MEATEEKSELEADGAYVLTGECICHECGCFVPVFAVMLVGPFKSHVPGPAEDDDAPLLQWMSELPAPLVAILEAKSDGRFRPDFSRTLDQRYWMNHCRECDVKIGDWFIQKPGQAFFPTSHEQMADVHGTYVDGPLVFTAPDLSVSSWTTEWLKRFPANAAR